MKRHLLIIVIISSQVIAVACKTSTPTGAVREIVNAMKHSDRKMLKRHLSEPALKRIREMADAKGKSVDDLLDESLSDSSVYKDWPDPLQTRNEIINGNTATVEVNLGYTRSKLYLSKEDGEWKMDFNPERSTFEEESQ